MHDKSFPRLYFSGEFCGEIYLVGFHLLKNFDSSGSGFVLSSSGRGAGVSYVVKSSNAHKLMHTYFTSVLRCSNVNIFINCSFDWFWKNN